MIFFTKKECLSFCRKFYSHKGLKYEFQNTYVNLSNVLKLEEDTSYKISFHYSILVCIEEPKNLLFNES